VKRLQRWDHAQVFRKLLESQVPNFVTSIRVSDLREMEVFEIERKFWEIKFFLWKKVLYPPKIKLIDLMDLNFLNS